MTEIDPQLISLKEALNPRATPELGFQAYEKLAGKASVRDAEREAFINDRTMNPEFDYPLLKPAELRTGISNLNDILDLAARQEDATISSAVWDSAAYRMAEMYWLLSSEHLVRLYDSMSDEQLDQAVSSTQELNEQLYGQPEKPILNAVVNEIYHNIEARTYSSLGQTLLNDLKHGIDIQLVDSTIELPPLSSDGPESLPTIPEDLLGYLKERLYAEHQDIFNLIKEYKDQVVDQRPEAERAFSTSDMAYLFQKVHELKDPLNLSGVEIITNPNSSSLAWDTPKMAVIVGMRRASLKTPEAMFSKIVHEYIVHAGRAIYGSSSNLAVLGSGLYTEAKDNEQSDYLTFEEGFASLCEAAVASDTTKWDANFLNKYLAIGLVYNGLDFRKTYETLWRVQALMAAPGPDLYEAMITKAKTSAYTAVTRILRGTPTNMPRTKNRVLTYNKDLAYLKGKLLAIDFWKQYKNNPRMLDIVFKGKFDPMNSMQAELAERSIV